MSFEDIAEEGRHRVTATSKLSNFEATESTQTYFVLSEEAGKAADNIVQLAIGDRRRRVTVLQLKTFPFSLWARG